MKKSALTGPVPYRPEPEVPSSRAAAERVLLGIPGVEGVGEGRNALGDPAWVVYASEMAVAKKVPREIEGRTVQVEFSGKIDAI